MMSATTTVITPNLKVIASRSSAASIDGYTPAQISKAYGFTGLTGNGAGQTIAIVDAFNDPAIASDLAVFSKQFGLPTATLQVVSQTGGSVKSLQTDTGWAGEIALDVEWAHAIAPGAKILLVETNSDNESDLMAGVKYARSASGVSVVSTSWGESEASSQLAYDSYFTTPAGHNGVTFVSSSGDEGASYGPEFPASSPNVLSVGGTTLTLDASGNIVRESAWRDSTGGASGYEAAPSYQTTVSGSTARTTPDVSYNGDPNTGFAVYDSIADSGAVGWQVVGGTSAGAPQWAALVAIANQNRVSNGLGTLDGTSQTLPTLYSLYAKAGSASYSTYTASFNDVASGGGTVRGRGGGWGGWGRGGFNGGTAAGGATAGYDTITGLGTPKAAAVVQALVGTSFKSTVSTKTTTTRKRHAKSQVVHPKSQNQTQSNNTAVAATPASSVLPVANAPAADGIARQTAGTLSLQQTAVRNAVGGASSVTISAAGIADPLLRRIVSNLTADIVSGTVGLGGLELNAVAPLLAASAGPAATAVVNVLEAGANVMHFPHFDPAVMFDDVISAFVSESTSMAGSFQTDARSWAWAVTAGVVAVDLLILARWMNRRQPARQQFSRAYLPPLNSLG